jgi:hypothetical protein
LHKKIPAVNERRRKGEKRNTTGTDRSLLGDPALLLTRFLTGLTKKSSGFFVDETKKASVPTKDLLKQDVSSDLFCLSGGSFSTFSRHAFLLESPESESILCESQQNLPRIAVLSYFYAMELAFARKKLP